MPKKAKFYSQTPAVPAKRLAGTNPMPGPTLGSAVLPTTPTHQGRIHGLGTPEHPFGHRQVKGVHGYGHLPRQRQGHLRLSGLPTGHQIGVPKGKSKK